MSLRLLFGRIKNGFFHNRGVILMTICQIIIDINKKTI